jgi:tetratricopeptide (TPR) repeat protein
MGERAQARGLYERALTILEKNLGPDHPRLAAAMMNLAVLDFEMGDLRAARPLFARALAIREKTYGPKHVAVANSLNSLANAA